MTARSTGELTAAFAEGDGPLPRAHVTRATHLVTMIDVDAVQISFRRYFDWVARGYEQFFAELGYPVAELLREGSAQPVASCSCRYNRPAGLGALIKQETWLIRIGRTSFEFRDQFSDDAGLLAVASTTRVWIRLEPGQQPEPVPGWLRDAAGGDRTENRGRKERDSR
jgi:acyl-CoA thioesterase FadM